jgi:predicted Ser/Thr protein kinase
MVDRIGHYRIVAELGRGGMGVVYKAHEESLNRFVAIKVLGEHLAEDEIQIERFLREARSAASLNHPNIVQIYAVSEEAGRHYFVMEYVSGRSLQQILKSSGPLDPLQVARIAVQTASGLQAAHERGIIHRDIKPANLLIDERGLVKIADFGLALMASGISRLTATGMFMGTPGYLSPEQCLDQEIDHRTDIYSLGVTLFEALAGKVPFAADSPLALLRQIVEVEPPDLGELKPEVDPELRKIVARMMAKNRDLRVASCAELIGGLEAFLEARGASGTLVERLAAAAGRPAPPRSTADEQLDSEPTLQVSGEAIGGATATAGGAETEAPVVETTPLEEPRKGSGRRLALVAAVVVLLGIGAVVTAGVLAWKSGLFAAVTRKLENRVAVTDGSEQTAANAALEPAADTEDDDVGQPAAAAGGSVAATTTGSNASEPEALSKPIPTSAAVTRIEPGADTSGRQDVDTSGMEPVRGVAPPPTLPPPRGTVVIAVGETVLAGEAETVIEGALSRAGVLLVDETSIPGLAAFIGGEKIPEPGEVRDVLRPYAANLVMVRVEYLGERPLMYMGQRDVAFQARLTVVPIDLQGGAALAAPVRLRTEYTHLNAQQVAEKELRRPANDIARLLAAR